MDSTHFPCRVPRASQPGSAVAKEEVPTSKSPIYEDWREGFLHVRSHRRLALDFLHLKLASFQAEIRTSEVPKLVDLPGLKLCTVAMGGKVAPTPRRLKKKKKIQKKRRDIEPNLPDGDQCHGGCPRRGQEAGAAELGSPGLHGWQCLADQRVASLTSAQKSQPPPASAVPWWLYPAELPLPAFFGIRPLASSQTVFHQGLQRDILRVKA